MGQFEEIGDVMDSTTKQCEIEILEDTFTDIQKVLVHTECCQFTTWWPSVAQKVVESLYMSKEAQRSAISLLMKIFDFKYTSIEPLKLVTDSIHQLYMLYREKLDVYRQHVVEVKNVWCDILRNCAMKCKHLMNEKNSLVISLKNKAGEFLHQSKNDSAHVNIIKSEYMNALKDIQKEFEYKLQLVKLDYKVKNPSVCNLSKIDKHISELQAEIVDSYNDIPKIQEAYTIECQNVEYEVAKQIQYECEQYWMDGLV